jgi:hypothetical protein
MKQKLIESIQNEKVCTKYNYPTMTYILTKLMSKHTKVVRELQRKQQEMIKSSVETTLRLSVLQIRKVL